MSRSNLPPIVTLTTDFGEGSSYVAQMKGVMLSRNAHLRLIDISHSVGPQDIRRAALLLSEACPRFPPRTIHVAVVDPGVGTHRDIVFAQIGNQRYLAPDNGLLTLLAQQTPPTQIVRVTNRLYFLPTVSPTFHGRDILAPVAAHLSLGLNPRRLGDAVDSLIMLPFSPPVVEERRIVGRVEQIDAFGNLITNIESEHHGEMLQHRDSVSVHCKAVQLSGLATTYGDRAVGSSIALIGSSGRLEIAMVQGSAAKAYQIAVDEPVTVTW